ncbi:MAG: methanogenesis marker 17 protein [Candidatus Methanomethyliaceae archaeon]|nr:methanogenesis marker 17 protein [Candidatus Methanomethyliaceae archaeon]MDW7970854.1 methanogenesis marker 17 protein [Nitrososphaerota archaeon]
MDSSDKKGGERYRHLIERAVEDLALGGSIKWLYAYIRPEIPLFIISISYREFERKNVLKDLAKFEVRSDSIKISLDNELDLADALRALWSELGRDKIEQIGRNDILVKGVDLEYLKEIKIREKAISVTEKITELISRILPEGFKIRRSMKRDEIIIIIASEDPIKEEWIKKAMEMIDNAKVSYI